MTDTKEEILNNSLNLFAKKGYHGTSIREIAGSVGIRKSSIYNHFSNKEAIFSELFEKLAPLNMENKILEEKLMSKINNPIKLLHYLGELITDEMKDEKKSKLLKIMIREHSDPDVQKKMRKRIESNVRAAEKIFSILIEKKKVKKTKKDAFFLANEFIGPIVFFRMRYLLFELDSIEDLVKEIEEHIDFFWENIKK